MKYSVYAKPGSTRGPLVEQTDSDALTVYVRERAIDGKANEAVVKAIAAFFNVTKSDVSILSGLGSRHKRVEVIL